jgi:hypothetical protein
VRITLPNARYFRREVYLWLLRRCAKKRGPAWVALMAQPSRGTRGVLLHSPTVSVGLARSFASFLHTYGRAMLQAHYDAMAASSFASRFRATCNRRLMVPIGESNRSLISTSDWPFT